MNTYQRGKDLNSRDPPRAVDRDFNVTKQYAEAVKEVGQKEGIPVLDVWTLLWDACGHVEQNLSEFLEDGLHLNVKGYEASPTISISTSTDSDTKRCHEIEPLKKIVYDNLIKLISEHYPELHYDNMRSVFAL